MTRKYKLRRFNGLLMKNFLVALLVIVVMLVVCSYLIYRNALSTMNAELGHANQLDAQRAATQADTLLGQIELAIADIETNSSVRLFFSDTGQEPFTVELYTRINEKISSYPIIYKYIHSVYLYAETSRWVFTREPHPVEEFEDNAWLEVYEAGGPATQIWTRRINGVYPDVITIMKRTSAYANKGAVIVNLNVRELGNALGGEHDESRMLYLVDEDDKVLYAADRAEWAQPVDSLPLLGRLLRERDAQTGIVRADGYSVQQWPSEKYGYTAYAITHLNKYNENLTNTIGSVTLITLGLLALGLGIAFLVAINAYRPVRRIMDILEMPERWSKGQKHSSEEVKYIAERIVSTIHENDDLHRELERRLELLNSANVKALQAQINPHFLSNSLNLVNLLVVDSLGPQHPSARMLSMLSKLLRYSLELSEPLVTVDTEVRYAKLYVEILKERYEGKVTAHWDIAPDIAHCMIPKLCFQPVIENAVYHGLCPRDTGGTLFVGGHRTERGVCLTISDDGVGIPPAEVERLCREIEDAAETGGHVGIRNVHQRIRLMFGEPYGVTIQSEEGQGTAITILLPPAE